MKKITKSLIAGVLSFAAMSANAFVIDFANMANTVPGEMGMQPLHVDIDGTLAVDIYGYDANGSAHAYLDAQTGGLGVCSVLDANNQCDPANDDNVTVGEYLKFVFTGEVAIDSMSFNNNHDGGFAAGAMVNIGGNSFAVSEPAPSIVIDPFSGVLQTEFTVAYNNTQFYVQTMTVPEPAGLALLGLGLLGFGAARRAKR